jgi:phage recombination protein Bet
MTALALREDQSYWDEGQLAVLEQSGISNDVTQAELSAFLHVCQRTGLDPFARQIYLIGRWDKRAGRKVYRPQTGIDGYRIVAQRTCERTGQSLGYEDTLWCGEDGQWTDAWLSKTPPAAAKVTVIRAGQRFSAVARWSEYVPLDQDGKITGLWVKRHAAQLEKCAEALALRKAFPNDMAGVYTAEEMAQADNPSSGTGEQPPAGQPSPGAISRPSAVPAAPAQGQPAEPDPDAQAFADEAHLARTTAELADIHRRAREARKLGALIRNPATGGTGGFGQYANWRKKQLEEAEALLAQLRDAAAGLGLSDADLDDHVGRFSSGGIEAATAAQLRDALDGLPVPA